MVFLIWNKNKKIKKTYFQNYISKGSTQESPQPSKKQEKPPGKRISVTNQITELASISSESSVFCRRNISSKSLH